MKTIAYLKENENGQLTDKNGNVLINVDGIKLRQYNMLAEYKNIEAKYRASFNKKKNKKRRRTK